LKDNGSIDHKAASGRPVTVRTAENIIKLINDNQCATEWR